MTPYERDLLVRTVLGEAGGEPDEGQRAVAAVVLNRLRSGEYGDSIADVILQPNAFEAWSHPSESMAYAADTPAYQRASRAIDMVELGNDPTNGAVNFLNPDLQAQMGRAQPKWATGDGQRIGRHVFYGGSPVQVASNADPFSMVFGDAAPVAINASADDPFAATFGTDFTKAPEVKPVSPPPKPRTWADTLKDLGAGALRGIQDVGDTVTERGLEAAGTGADIAAHFGVVSPSTAEGVHGFTRDYTATNRAIRNKFEAEHPASQPIAGFIPSDPASIGRLGGQIIATAPAVMAAPAVTVTGNAIADAALTGSLIGGETAALTTSANDEPIVPQVLGGMAAGGVVGAAAPTVSRGAAALGNKLVGKIKEISEPAVVNVSNLLKKIGLTPEDAAQAVRETGPGATLADINPALRGEVGALAARGEDTTSLIKSRYGKRGEQGGARVAQAIDDTLGSKPDLTLVEKKIETDAQKAAKPFYDKAYASTAGLDVAPVVARIDNLLETVPEAGKTAAALTRFRKLLTRDDKPTTDLPSLHAARMEMDDYIANARTKARSNVVSKLSGVRSELDKILKSNPDMAAGDKAFAEGMKVGDFLTLGQSIFKNDTRLEDLTRSLANATPAQLQAFRDGARVAIGDIVGGSSRGELTDAATLFGKKTVNQQKLRLAFPGEADDVLSMVRANQAMRTTENKVLNPSQTAEYTAAQKRYMPEESKNSILSDIGTGAAVGVATGEPLFGVGAGIAHKIGARAAQSLKKRHFDKLAQETAHALSASGPELDRILDQLSSWSAGEGRRRVANKLINFGAGAAPLVRPPSGPLEITVPKGTYQGG